MNSFRLIMAALLFAGICLLTSCKDDPEEKLSTVKIQFNHMVDGQALETHQMKYVNAAGNQYEVSEIMYFISDLKMYRHDGQVISPFQTESANIHYIDTDISESLMWTIGNYIAEGWSIGNDIPEGVYDSITFTFGLSEARNKSNTFVNPPEVNMAWPEVLGGGYHYMMLNGFWLDSNEVKKPLNFHLGIGQIYENNSGQVEDITGFIHNNFTVKPEGGQFTVSANTTTTLQLSMHVDSWFETPVIFDFNIWGSAIMQKQDAMHAACLNGKDAFTLSISGN